MEGFRGVRLFITEGGAAENAEFSHRSLSHSESEQYMGLWVKGSSLYNMNGVEKAGVVDEICGEWGLIRQRALYTKLSRERDDEMFLLERF